MESPYERDLIAHGSDELLDAEKLAKHYGVSVSTIYQRRVYKPELLPPSIKLGRSVRWRVGDVVEFDRRHVVEGKPKEKAMKKGEAES